MAANLPRGSVRMGPLTLLSTVIIICLAVLAVLSVTTALANSKTAENQSKHIASTYADEKAAQEFVAEVDGILADTSSKGLGKSSAIETMREQLPSGAKISDDGEIRIAFTARDTHKLNVTLRINEDLTYEIAEWKFITTWDESYQEQTSWQEN